MGACSLFVDMQGLGDMHMVELGTLGLTKVSYYLEEPWARDGIPVGAILRSVQQTGYMEASEAPSCHIKVHEKFLTFTGSTKGANWPRTDSLLLGRPTATQGGAQSLMLGWQFSVCGL